MNELILALFLPSQEWRENQNDINIPFLYGIVFFFLLWEVFLGPGVILDNIEFFNGFKSELYCYLICSRCFKLLAKAVVVHECTENVRFRM